MFTLKSSFDFVQSIPIVKKGRTFQCCEGIGPTEAHMDSIKKCIESRSVIAGVVCGVRGNPSVRAGLRFRLVAHGLGHAFRMLFFALFDWPKIPPFFFCTKKQTCLYICYVISLQVESKKQDVDTRAAKKNIFAVGYQRYCTHRKQLIRKIAFRIDDQEGEPTIRPLTHCSCAFSSAGSYSLSIELTSSNYAYG